MLRTTGVVEGSSFPGFVRVLIAETNNWGDMGAVKRRAGSKHDAAFAALLS